MTETSNLDRGKRKERIGEVLSNKMAKTIVVRVERRFAHRQFKKVVTQYKKFYAHDEKSEAKPGDRVRIAETRPVWLDRKSTRLNSSHDQISYAVFCLKKKKKKKIEEMQYIW